MYDATKTYHKREAVHTTKWKDTTTKGTDWEYQLMKKDGRQWNQYSEC